MLDQALAILTFQAGYNTAMVLAGTVLLGIAAGVVGVFALLRRRALVSDAISHGTLPGVAVAFLTATALGGQGKSLPVLLTGAAVTGGLAVLCVQWIRDHTRLPEDTAIGTVLSVFFGAGMVLLSYIQTLPGGSRAGLGSFLLGQTAALNRDEAWLIAIGAAAVILICLALFKELAVLCFDPDYAASQGWPTGALDLALMALLLGVVCIGLKTVGIILIIALLIVPPVAARFWTERLGRMTAIAAFFGGLSAYLGTTASALLPDLPAGGIIVLAAGALFAISLLFAPRRGVVAASVRHLAFRAALARRRGLLALAAGRRVNGGLAHWILRLDGALRAGGTPTAAGRTRAEATIRDQELWDRYLQDFPQDALARPDWAARPAVEVLAPDLVAELRRRVAATNDAMIGGNPAGGTA